MKSVQLIAHTSPRSWEIMENSPEVGDGIVSKEGKKMSEDGENRMENAKIIQK